MSRTNQPRELTSSLYDPGVPAPLRVDVGTSANAGGSFYGHDAPGTARLVLADGRVVEYNIGWVTGASIEADGYTGKANLVVDEARGVPIGATFVGQDTAELLHSATIAIVGEVPLSTLWHAVPSFPTISEVWLRLLETYGL